MANYMTNLCGAVILLLALACARALGDDNPFVRVQGIEFVLNGKHFLFNGFNSYWMMYVAAGTAADRSKISEVFHEAAVNGLTVCRTWAFNDGGDRALQVSPGVYDEQVFQGLDFVISEAQKYGVGLILSLVNNYKDFGGRPQYIDWARNAGENVNNEDDFYTNPVAKEYYKNHVKSVLTRVNTITKLAYRDDPTIMAWELINEPRCHSDYSGRTIDAWVQEMASYVKSLDNKHMLEIGMEGFYGDSNPAKKKYNPGFQVGTDYIRSNLIKEIDFATIHAYPDVWLSDKSDFSQTVFVERWMWSHWDDSRKILGKPLILSEFGMSKKDQGYTDWERDSYLNAVYRGVYGLARAGGGSMGGCLVWQIVAEGMDSYHDGYEIVLSQDPSTTRVISKQSRVMAVLAHRMGEETRGDGDEKGGKGSEDEQLHG